MTTYTRDELNYYRRTLNKYLKKYYESYLEYLRHYYETNLKLTLRKK